MDNITFDEYKKLTPYQKAKFDELIQWYSGTQKDSISRIDTSYMKMIEWVKRLEEPKEK
jgi:hypothetical protein